MSIKVEFPNGDVEWHCDGGIHREDGPAIERNGNKYWIFKGNYHREDGPAIELVNGDSFWFYHGKRHCNSGPAVSRNLGHGHFYVEWWINGDFVNSDEIIHEINLEQ